MGTFHLTMGPRAMSKLNQTLPGSRLIKVQNKVHFVLQSYYVVGIVKEREKKIKKRY